MKNIIAAVLVFAMLAVPSLAWFDTGYPFRAVEKINYTGSSPIYNFTYPINSTRFNVGGIDTGDQTVWVKIPVLNPGINSQFLYYNDNYNYTSVATNDLTQNGMQVDIGNSSNVSSAWDSNYVTSFPFTVEWDDTNFGFCRSDSLMNSGTYFVFQNGACPVLGTLLDAPNSPEGNAIIFAGNGNNEPAFSVDPITSYTSFTLETVVLMNAGNVVISYNDIGASNVYLQLTEGGSSYCTVYPNQFGFMIENTTQDKTCIAGNIPAPRTGTDYNYVAVTLSNHVLSIYVNGQLQNTTTYNDSARFTSSETPTIADDPVNFASSQVIMDYLSTSNTARSSDWINARYKSLISNYDAYGVPAFSRLGAQQVQNPSLNLTIQSPSGSYAVGTLPVNFSVAYTTEGQLDTTSCSYQVDSNPAVAIPGCQNTTTLVNSAGNHTITVFASSLDGASVNTTSLFDITVFPASLNLTMVSPAGNYDVGSLPANLSLELIIEGQLNTSSCSYSIDGNASVPVAGCANTTFLENVAGNHSISFAASSLDGASESVMGAYSVTLLPPAPVPGPEHNISFLLELIAGVVAAGWIVVLSRLAFEDLQEENYTGLWKLVIIAFIGITMIGVLFAVIQGLI